MTMGFEQGWFVVGFHGRRGHLSDLQVFFEGLWRSEVCLGDPSSDSAPGSLRKLVN